MVNFWENILRYPKFLITSVSGLILIILSPFIYLFKRTTNKIFYFTLSAIFFSAILYILSQMIEIV